MSGSVVRVMGFPRETKKVDLQHFLKGCGKVLKVFFIRANIAMVTFNTEEDAEHAVCELNGKKLLGMQITVDKPRSRIPIKFKLIVKNLSSSVSWQNLKDYMRKAGKVIYCNAHKPHLNEGVVHFASYSDLKAAVEVLDDTPLHGKRIRLEEDIKIDDGCPAPRSRSGSLSSRSTSISLSASRSSSCSSIEVSDHKHKYPDSGVSSCSQTDHIYSSCSQNRSRSSSRSASTVSKQSSNGSAQRRSRSRSQPGVSSTAENECPSCFSFMSPPIGQCSEAHCICSDCPNYMRKCEVCRGVVPMSCVISLQRGQSFETRPCRYSSQGCDYIGSGVDLASHHVLCKITTMECPLKFMKCSWLGKLPKMPQHCAECHPNNFHSIPKKRFLISNFVELQDRRFDKIFNVFDTFFRCAWEISKATGFIKIAVYHVGSPLIANQFDFRVIIHSDNSPVFTTLGGHVFQMYNYNERFVEEKYVRIDHDFIKCFCHIDGSLHYTISILEKGIL